ncbi:hypothetical protein ACJIZ3_010789 [Penstemon smallii]|uniref:Uncharacterized protein n=1 Tax=Penstemon smallii TaxID=265156 RepID=A0ABD3UIQ4_9LAMI
MSYMKRVWMATTVAVVNSHSEQGQKLRSGLKSLNHGKKRFFSGGHGPDAADLRPFSAAVNSQSGGILGGGEGKRNHAEESLHQVMYLNCWGPS